MRALLPVATASTSAQAIRVTADVDAPYGRFGPHGPFVTAYQFDRNNVNAQSVTLPVRIVTRCSDEDEMLHLYYYILATGANEVLCYCADGWV